MPERLDEYDYELPEELIAQRPAEKRDESRLLVLHRASGEIEHRVFRDLPEYLRPTDVLVRNNTRVRPVRIHIKKEETGANIELLLLEPADGLSPADALSWRALARPAKRLRQGARLCDETGALAAECVDAGEGGQRTVAFLSLAAREQIIESSGEMPLPPYIHERSAEPDRYQTLYARIDGSAAAPTAGFHFSETLLEALDGMGVGFVDVTLHIGLDTFRPVEADIIDEHKMHTERFEVPDAVWERLSRAKEQGGRAVMVGTTSVRAMESAALGLKKRTNLFIRPGFRFQCTQAMITNFHLPRSTLLMMVSAFAGKEAIRRAYRAAVEEKYRFYSFGDAMLIL